MYKSDNQGFKEATFIQTGRKGGDMEISKEVQRGREVGEAWAWNGQSHIHVWWRKIKRDT